jgi:hypothetical protein
LNTNVHVYYNLNRKCFSVQQKTKKGWRLSFHTDELTLENAVFRVYEKGRQRVLKSGHKNVHAFLLGKISKSQFDSTLRVRYNPFKAAHFFLEDGQAIHRAKRVKLTRSGVFIDGKERSDFE